MEHLQEKGPSSDAPARAAPGRPSVLSDTEEQLGAGPGALTGVLPREMWGCSLSVLLVPRLELAKLHTASELIAPNASCAAATPTFPCKKE